MKTELTLNLLMKATAACVLLTVLEILLDHFTDIHVFSRRDFEMIFAWIIVGIAWIFYLINWIRTHRKEKETTH